MYKPRADHPWKSKNYSKRKCATTGCDKGALVGNQHCFDCSGAAIAQDNYAAAIGIGELHGKRL
jgi:hypothetical protein